LIREAGVFFKMIIISAGRRIDALDAKQARFPLNNAGRVATEVRARLQDLRARVVVSSAACGADLIVLKEAQALGVQLRIVLPFEPARFRQTSVVDRPGDFTWDWGSLFDELVEHAEKTGALIVLPPEGDETAAYIATNRRILEEALKLSQEIAPENRADPGRASITALIIWEGSSRGEDDLTAQLMSQAREAEIPVEQVLTL